tara:strand:- start:146 stop:415 length:270 start_codon:yes stop_codon:yes gene_type:complete
MSCKPKYKQYEITITARTPSKLKDVIWYMHRMLPTVLPFSFEIKAKEVEDRPTNDEHHGGYQNDPDDPKNYPSDDIVMEAYRQNIPERY